MPFPASGTEGLALEDPRHLRRRIVEIPEDRHSVGHTMTHAGWSWFSTRFAQKLHFSAVCVLGSINS